MKPVWSIIDRPWHCIDRAGYLWENRPLSTPRKSLSCQVESPQTTSPEGGNGRMRQAAGVEKHVIGAHSRSGIPFGPPVITAPQPEPCLCTCPSPETCVHFCLRENVCHHRVWFSVPLLLWLTPGLKAGPSEGSEFFKKQVRAHLVVIGRSKKGPCVLGNWQRKPDPTQCNPARPVQYRTSQHREEKEKKKAAATAGLLPFNPPCISRLLANSHNPTVKPPASFLFFSFFFI